MRLRELPRSGKGWAWGRTGRRTRNPLNPVEEIQDRFLTREDLVLCCAGRMGIGPSRRGILLGRDWRSLC